MRQRITGVSAYFYCMRVAGTIDSLKSEDRHITDITRKAAIDNQRAANAIANILLSRR
jgi:hypothetical protein